MKGQLRAATPAGYIAQLAEPRRSDVAALDALVRETAPALAPYIHSGMLAYGPCRYKYESGREGDWFRIGIASNQNYISLYVTCGGDLVARYRKILPKANLGKCCVRFKRLADLDLEVIRQLIREGAGAAAQAC